MRRDNKSVVNAGMYRHALRLQKQINTKNEALETVQTWVDQTDSNGNVLKFMGYVEQFGGYEGAAQTARQAMQLLNLETRYNPDYEDMTAMRYRWIWEHGENPTGVSKVPQETVLSIQTVRNIYGKDRKWRFVCFASIARQSS